MCISGYWEPPQVCNGVHQYSVCACVCVLEAEGLKGEPVGEGWLCGHAFMKAGTRAWVWVGVSG